MKNMQSIPLRELPQPADIDYSHYRDIRIASVSGHNVDPITPVGREMYKRALAGTCKYLYESSHKN